MNELFHKISAKISNATGSPLAFILAIGVILVWAISGKLFDYSDTWQLVINTGTTIVTFLMVFLIQNTQNRDAKALHLKMDEVIRATKGARNSMVNIEEVSDADLDAIHLEFQLLHEKAAKELVRRNKAHTD